MKSRLDDVRLYNLTPPDIQSASFMISVASRDAVGGFLFYAFCAKNISVVVYSFHG